MLLAVLALSILAPAGPGHDTPVRLKLSSGGDYSPGDRARVHVRVARDGYLLVMRMNSDGSARVLYPLSPKDEATIDGGADTEIKGRGDREAFAVGGRESGGVVLAAWSARPFRTEEWIRNGHWDLSAVTDSAAGNDPEAGLVAMIDRVVEGTFEYDVMQYTVAGQRYVRGGGWYDPWYGPGWGYGPRGRIGVSVGRRGRRGR